MMKITTKTNSTDKMPTKRIDYLDLTKTVAIYLVIFGHCLFRLDKDLSTGGVYVNSFTVSTCLYS